MAKKITGILVISLLSALTIAGYWLTATTSGLRFVLDTVVHYVPLPLSYSDVQGSIVTSIRADKARYEADSVTVLIQDFETGFALRSLLRSKLNFSNVRASHIEVVLKSNDAEGQSADAGGDTVAVPSADSEPGLPLSIAIERLNVGALTVSSSSGEPVIFKDISIEESLIKENFQFTKFGFQHELGRLVASGELGFSMSADLNMELQWSVPAKKTLPAFGGQSTLSGSYRHLETTTTIKTPYQYTIHAVADDPFNELKWRGRVTGSRLPLAMFDPSVALEFKDLDFKWSGALTNINIEGGAGIHDPQLGDWAAELNGEISTDQWTVANLELRSRNGPTHLQLQGKSKAGFDYSRNASFDAQVTWDNLQWPFKKTADTAEAVSVQSRSGQIQWSGSVEQYQLEVHEADVAWQEHQVETLNIKANGNLNSLTVSSYAGNYLNGKWQGSGSLSWTDGLKWQTLNTMSNVDTSGQWPQWPALLSGSAKVNGGLKDDRWNLDGSISKLSGKLRGVPIDRAAFQFNAAPGDYQVRELNFKAGNNRLAGAARIKVAPDDEPVINANWTVNAANLSQLLPNAGGELYSRGTVGGTFSSPELSVSANGKQLNIGDYRVAMVKLDAGINGYVTRKVAVDLQMEDAFYQTWHLKNATVKANGLLANHNIKLMANVDDNRRLSVQVTGNYSDKNWAGQLLTAEIATGTLGEWYLPQPVALEVSDQKLSIKNGCFSLRKDSTRTCFSIHSKHFTEWQGNLAVTELSANRLKSYFPQMLLDTKGVFNGGAKFDLDGNHIRTLDAELKSKKGALVYGFPGTEQQQFEYEAFSVALMHGDRGITVNAHVDLQKQGKVTGHLLLKDKHSIGPLTPDQNLQGQMILDLNDLAILHLVYPEVQFKEGSKYSEFKVSGSFGKPLFLGHTSVKVKSALLPRLGIELKDLALRLDYDEQRGIKAKGHVVSGDGYVDIDGQIVDYLAENLQASMNIKGDKFQAINTAEINANVSPDLKLAFQDNELRLRGSLLIPGADVKMLDSPTAVAPSGDVVFIDEQRKGEGSKKEATPITLDAEVRVTLGEFIRIQGFGAKGKLRGEVIVREDKTGITKGSGEVYIVDGKYNAYGRELSIETGKLIYTSSPVDNPLVDIKAQRRINEQVVVGVNVSGYAQNPEVTLFSEPTMDNADVLSYMMLGYPISQASEQDGATLASAAGSIGLVGGELLAKNIAKEFGIDEVEVKSDNTTQQTSLVLGKYLSPRLYAQYAVGIGQAVNAFRLEYQLTKQWVLKTETTDIGQSTDLLFTIER